MSNFELIDDYLSNRLSEQDKKSFEQQLEGDPALNEEVEFQRQVVRGVQRARMTELKTMLNNVPVNGGSWSAGGKVAAAVATAGLIASFLYFYTNDDALPTKAAEEINQEIISPDNTPAGETLTPSENKENKTEGQENSIKENSKASTEKKSPAPVHKPELQVVDPSDEFKETEGVKDDASNTSRSAISASKMEVLTGLDDKKHTFHYQFVDGKLLLYGPFDKSLYEILEIHGDSHAVFLFYKENYYLLDENQTAITPLDPIRDSQLLKRLREYRGQ